MLPTLGAGVRSQPLMLSHMSNGAARCKRARQEAESAIRLGMLKMEARQGGEQTRH